MLFLNAVDAVDKN